MVAAVKTSAKDQTWTVPFQFVVVILRTFRGMAMMIMMVATGVILYPPILIWRSFAIYTSKWFLGYGRILTPRDIFTYEEPNDAWGAPRCALVTTTVLEGDISLEEMRKTFQEKVLNAGGSNLRYPELQQHETSWMGFRFMTKYEDFKIEEHIIESSDPYMRSLREVHQLLMNKKFPSDRSPWQLILFREVISGHVILGFRINHSIADALSVLKVFVECLGGKTLVKASPQDIKRRLLGDFWFRLNYPVSVGNDCISYWGDAVKQFQRGRVIKVRPEATSNKRVVVVGLSDTIAMRDVKLVGKMYKVTTSAVIMAGVMGGLENFTRKMYGAQDECDISVGYVLPLPGHPERLANHWTTTYTTIKYGGRKSRSPRKKLRSYNDAVLEMKTSTRKNFLKCTVDYSGSCVVKLANALLKNRVCSIGMTNIAGDDEGFQIDGRKCVDFSLSSGGLDGIELLFCIMSYKGQFRVSIITEMNVMNENNVILLSEFIRDEFDRLKESAISRKGDDFDSNPGITDYDLRGNNYV